MTRSQASATIDEVSTKQNKERNFADARAILYLSDKVNYLHQASFATIACQVGGCKVCIRPWPLWSPWIKIV